MGNKVTKSCTKSDMNTMSFESKKVAKPKPKL